MRKILVTMAVLSALLLGGCSNAAVETASPGNADTGSREQAVEAGGAVNGEGAEVTDGVLGEDGNEDASGEKEMAVSEETEGGNKEDAASDGEDGSADAAAEIGNGKESGESVKDGAEESRKPQLADYEITVFSKTETMYASDPVNVRKGPSVDFDRVGGLGRGQEVAVTGQADTGWYEIVYGKEKAYVSGRYLQKEKPEEEPENPPAEEQETAQAQNAAEGQAAQTPEYGQAEAQAAMDVQAAAQEQAAAADAQAMAETQAAAEAQAVPAAVQEVKNVAGVIMVGDSRFVQMQQNIGENSCTWIAEGGKGYNWFNETAIARIDGCVGKGSKVLINLGVNDPGHVNDYLALVNAKAAEWVSKGAVVYYASVNPVWDNPYTTEEQVQYFNSQMQAGLSGDVHWIDSHSYLTSIGYKLVDGLHYNAETYQNIYAYFMSCL